MIKLGVEGALGHFPVMGMIGCAFLHTGEGIYRRPMAGSLASERISGDSQYKKKAKGVLLHREMGKPRGVEKKEVGYL